MGTLLSILGSLPASSSEKGKLSQIDYLKMARMGIVLVASYVGVAVIEAITRDLSSGAFGIPAELTTPITGALAIALEWLRRKMATPAA